MGLLYVTATAFFTIFYPKQITDVICYGRHRDQERIKTKKMYYLIRIMWTLFFGMLSLMMGSATGLDNTFHNMIDFGKLNFTDCSYIEIRNGDSDMYHISKEVNSWEQLEIIIQQIINENSILCYYYEIDGLEVSVHSSAEAYIVKGEVVMARVEIENSLLLKKLDFQWNEEALETIRKGD